MRIFAEAKRLCDPKIFSIKIKKSLRPLRLNQHHQNTQMQNIIFPKPLKKGDKIAIISPAGSVQIPELEKTLEINQIQRLRTYFRRKSLHKIPKRLFIRRNRETANKRYRIGL